MIRAAFYDLDGTLVSANVVTRYAFAAKNHPSPARAALKYAKLLVSVPLLFGLDLYSRRLFNEVFFREYRGMRKDWLEELSEPLFRKVIQPSIYPGAKALTDSDREQGFHLVLVTGALDFDLPAVTRHFGFDDVICNSLVYENGTATGRVARPVIAEEQKREALIRYCERRNVDSTQSKAYADSFADFPVLESVGFPVAVHPDRRLRRVARERGWPILDLKSGFRSAARERNHVGTY